MFSGLVGSLSGVICGAQHLQLSECMRICFIFKENALGLLEKKI